MTELKCNRDNNFNIYVPEEILETVNNIFKNEYSLSHNLQYDKNLSKRKIIGVYEGFQKNIILNKKKFNLKVFKCFHTIPCFGYGLSQYKTKLKDKYKYFCKNQLVNLKKENIDILDIVLDYLFLYLGDTTHEVFYYEKNIDIFKYKYIMVECTFLLDENLKNAEKTKHMHWNNLKIIIENNPKITFILYHFSKRYTGEFIENFFKNENIIPWISN